MQWKDAYRLGIEQIDRQHEELFRIANRIQDIVIAGDSERTRRACEEAVKYLKNYTLQHFQDEEIYQTSVGYEGYIRHKALHEEFRQTVLMQEQFMQAADFSTESVTRFLGILSTWLVNHILREDQKITPGPGRG